MEEGLSAWVEEEILLEAAEEVEAAYTRVEVTVIFRGRLSGRRIVRPAFWDGGRRWRVRFAPPVDGDVWAWESTVEPAVPGLAAKGVLSAVGDRAGWPLPEAFHKHGFWRMSPGGRNLMHADGTPVLLAADTLWALPWRATEAQCRTIARVRADQGFNGALMMVVQPDMRAEGPEDRTALDGFARGFRDLPQGHLNELIPEYFQTLDRLTAILIGHGIVPIYQPVFHGFGWKGLGVAGQVVSNEEMARFARYLVARYGARPAIYLVGGDAPGDHPNVEAAGKAVHEADAYAQPTGIHYSPHATNDQHQKADWLDFQWCQTGHNGEHILERVMDMWRNTPPKGVANAEPTYENIGRIGNASGWWQGHEAWSNLCAGGTMGVFYGAGSLWQMKLSREEQHPEWAQAPGLDWEDALAFPGAAHVGRVRKLLEGLPFADMRPNWDCTLGRRGLVVPGKLLIVYLEQGGFLTLSPQSYGKIPMPWTAYDARTGNAVASGKRETEWESLHLPQGEPLVVIFS